MRFLARLTPSPSFALLAPLGLLTRSLAAVALVLSVSGCDFELNGDIPIAGKHVHISVRNGTPSCGRAAPRP